MIYRRYYIQVVLRVVLIVCFSLVFASLIFTTNHRLPALLMFLAILFVTINLIRYINKTNQYLSNFLLSLKESDGTFPIADTRGYSPISDLHAYFNEIKGIMNHIKIEKEKQYHYIQYIIDNVDVGIISFDNRGKIELSNQAAKKMLHIPIIYNLQDLGRVSEGLDRFVLTLEPHKPMVYRLNHGDEILQLSMKASMFSIDGKSITLVSFQDIQNALEDRELDSWQKLIRVLTHEIMNSVTPINTLTNSLRRFFLTSGRVKTSKEIDDLVIEEAVQGLELIDDRGKALIKFVNNYRSLTRLPEPHFQKVKAETIFRNMQRLFDETFKKQNIHFSIRILDDVTLFVDEHMIEQVFINLIRNSMEALKNTKSPLIQLTARRDSSQRVVLIIEDNGKGIPDDIINHIFIPFFTTRDGGSGIGLALSRQIMRLHKGSITVQSQPGKPTLFYLKF